MLGFDVGKQWDQLRSILLLISEMAITNLRTQIWLKTACSTAISLTLYTLGAIVIPANVNLE